MNGESGNRAPDRRVRPSLRWFAIVAFTILIPIAAHGLWDYIEVRRLVREIEAIRAKGEPVRERDAVGETGRCRPKNRTRALTTLPAGCSRLAAGRVG